MTAPLFGYPLDTTLFSSLSSFPPAYHLWKALMLDTSVTSRTTVAQPPVLPRESSFAAAVPKHPRHGGRQTGHCHSATAPQQQFPREQCNARKQKTRTCNTNFNFKSKFNFPVSVFVDFQAGYIWSV